MEGDWEMLQEQERGHDPSPPAMGDNSRDFEGIEGDSEGAIRSDYFALDSESRYPKRAFAEDDREESSVESDNPSWVDPGTERDEGKGQLGFAGTDFPGRNSGGFWSDSSSDGSVSRKFGDFDGKFHSGYADDAKIEPQVGGFGVDRKDFGKFWSDSGGDASAYRIFSSSEVKGGLGSGEVGFEGIDVKRKISGEFWSDSGSDISVGQKYGGLEGEGDLGWDDLLKTGEKMEFAGSMEAKEAIGSVSASDEGEGGEFSANTKKNVLDPNDVKSVDEEKKRVAWWKLPLELLKFCAFRISPVWSFSIAAAVMGFVLLGRRLYKMKHKTQSIQLKLSLDDKKVSLFTSRAARLNEAFSVVKRVPIIRASLPAAGGVTPWPAMSLR